MKALALLLLSLMTALPAWAIDVESLRGPRLEELYFVIVRDSDAQLLALERGTTHLVTDLIRPVDIERLARRDDVVLSLTPAFHMMEMGFNLRRSPGPEGTAPGHRLRHRPGGTRPRPLRRLRPGPGDLSPAHLALLRG